jgi:quercetin dioxygenase-like cupin family protein
LHIVVQDWGIHGRKPVEKFPEEGFMIVHLLAGKVATVIDGKEQTHKGGDFWTVSPGSHMSVQVTSESASLQTLAVRQN